MTLARLASDEFIDFASSSRFPTLDDFATLSFPARSTKVSFDKILIDFPSRNFFFFR